jgi:AcrR family transcriptional regulator
MSRAGAVAGGSSTGQSARRRIVTGARHHFFAHGFRGVTMDDLAGELGTSKKTLYAHFPGKAALVEAAILDKFRDLEADLEEVTAAPSAGFVERLRQLLACLQRHTEEIRPPFVRDVRRDAPDLFKVVESRRAELIQRHFGKLFARGRAAGMVRKDLPARLVIEVLLGAVQAVVNPQKVAELRLTPRAAFSGVISVILDGVLTANGRSDS